MTIGPLPISMIFLMSSRRGTFWRQLSYIDPLEVVCHRVVWAWVILLCLAPVLVYTAAPQLRRELSEFIWKPRIWITYATAACLITINWLVFIWAVSNDRVVDASLGYYINPLLNVLLGVLVIRESLGRTQWLAVGVATVGVSVMAVAGQGVPWVSLLLAVSFSLYGLVKRNAPMPPLLGLLLETTILVGPAIWLLTWRTSTPRLPNAFASPELLLVLGGLLTIMPLALFAFAARRVPLSTLGILQYIGPTLQFLIGVLIFSEDFKPARIFGFVCVWIALLIYVVGSNLKFARSPVVAAPDSAA
jgi:chloramphenicol-sensitive protein RarD